MNLSELEPRFLSAPEFDEDGRETSRYVDSIQDAGGIRFLCPVCFRNNGGAVGTHGIMCWNGTVSQKFSPRPGRWDMSGTGFHDLTLTGAHSNSNSIALTNARCGAHFHIKNGKIE